MKTWDEKRAAELLRDLERAGRLPDATVREARRRLREGRVTEALELVSREL